MRVIIIEDEALASQNLVKILNKFSEIELEKCLESVSEAVEWLKTMPHPNLIFMDIHLSDGSAFEIFAHVDIKCPVVFTTAYDEYALRAFKVNSIDYLLKPVDIHAVSSALEKFKNLGEKKEIPDIHNFVELFRKSRFHNRYFLVTVKGEKLMPLNSADIAYIFIDTGRVKAKTFENASFMMEQTLDELESSLNPYEFFRANRQYIIARKAVRDIDFFSNNRLAINLKIAAPEKILVSKVRVPVFKSWFAQPDISYLV